jgi:hypothetical protein
MKRPTFSPPSANRSLAAGIWRWLNGPGWAMLCLACAAAMVLWGGLGGMGLPPAAERAASGAADATAALWPAWPARLALALLAAGALLRLLHGYVRAWAAPPPAASCAWPLPGPHPQGLPISQPQIRRLFWGEPWPPPA